MLMTFEPSNLKDVREITLDNIINTVISESDIHGFGLFATQEILNETILCNLDGQVIDREHYASIEKRLSLAAKGIEKYLFMECNYINEKQILARTFRTKYSYINHSFKPNVELRYFPIRIVAIKNIDIGEELTIDYRNEPLTDQYLSRPEKAFLQKEGK